LGIWEQSKGPAEEIIRVRVNYYYDVPMQLTLS